MDKLKRNEYAAAAVCCLFAFACIFIGLSFFIFLLPLPFVLTYSVARGGYVKGGAAAVIALGCSYFLDAHACALFSAAFLIPAFAAGYSIRSKKRFLHSAAITSAGALAGAALMIYITTLFSGLEFVDYVSASFANQLSSDQSVITLSLYKAVRYADVLTGAITQAAVDSTTPAQAIEIMTGMFKDMLSASLVSIIALYSLIGGLLYYVIPRAIAKNNKMDIAVLPAFSDFALPRGFWIAALASFAAAILGAELGWSGFYVLESTVFDIYAFVFTIQALCFLDFLYKRRKIGTGARVLLHILALLIFGYLLSVIGLIENAIYLRKRMDEKQESD